MTSALAYRKLVLPTFAAALTCSTLGACQGRDAVVSDTVKPGLPDSGPGMAPAPQPGKQCPTGTPPTNTMQLNACLENIVFDTVPALGDEQRLMVPPRRYGPLVKIEPVMDAHKYTDTEMSEGRIIARFVPRKGEKGYPKLGIVAGQTTVWWARIDKTGRGGQSFYISVGSRDSLVRRSDKLRVDKHPGRFKQAVARWVWYEDDEKGQGTCGQGCCK